MAESPRRAGTTKPVISTIDDDPQVLRAVERDLRKQYGREYRVLWADSGRSALAVCSTWWKLGLDIVRRIVARHEGDVRVISTPGSTRFSVRLPLKIPQRR